MTFALIIQLFIHASNVYSLKIIELSYKESQVKLYPTLTGVFAGYNVFAYCLVKYSKNLFVFLILTLYIYNIQVNMLDIFVCILSKSGYMAIKKANGPSPVV